MHVNFDFSETKKHAMHQQLGSKLRQSWRQAVVALVAVAVCIQLLWSVQSSPVQSSPVPILGYTETHHSPTCDA